jgi:hypothetical protein
VFASVLEDASPSSFMPDFQSSERDACGCSNRRLEKEINVFLQQVFPAREAGALPEDQKQAAQKRRKIRQLLGLPAMGKGKKAK